MNDKQKLEICKRKLIQLKEKIKQFDSDKSILIDVSNELDNGRNAKLNILLYGISLKEDISYLNDWAQFYINEIKKYEIKSKKLQGIDEGASNKRLKEKIVGISEPKKDIEYSFKFIFKEPEERPTKEIKAAIKEGLINKFKAQNLLVKYTIPIIILLLMITSLFLLKPSLTGYTILSKETTYNQSLSLKINESGNYTWNVKNPGDIKSLKASGSVSGNGTVKVYIEKTAKNTSYTKINDKNTKFY